MGVALPCAVTVAAADWLGAVDCVPLLLAVLLLFWTVTGADVLGSARPPSRPTFSVSN